MVLDSQMPELHLLNWVKRQNDDDDVCSPLININVKDMCTMMNGTVIPI